MFNFTEDQLMMQKVVRDFAEKELAPGVAERDEPRGEGGFGSTGGVVALGS